MTLKPTTPIATAQAAVAGSALMILSYLLSFLPFPHSPSDVCISQALWIARYELLCVLLPGILGIVLSWRYASLFGKGVRTGIWTDEQVDQARGWIESRPINVVQTLLILAFFVVAIFSLSHHHPGRHTHFGFAYTFIFVLNPITSIRTALRKPLVTGPRTDWRHSAPIHSDHWGPPSNS